MDGALYSIRGFASVEMEKQLDFGLPRILLSVE